MKSNNKRILFVLAILTMALVLSCAFVACDKKDTGDKPNSNDLGVYYEVVGSSLDEKSYIELKSGNVWYDGEDQGTFKINGGNITLYDGDLELMSGTISNGVLTLSFMGETTVYKKSGSMGSGNVDQKAMIKSIQNGKVDGLTVSLEIDNTVEDVDLSGMITTSKDCSWQLYTSRTATSADAIVTKIIVPKNGNNTYYIVVTSADGKTNRTYTLNVWKNYYVTLSFYANGTLYTSEQVLTHTTYGSGPSCSVAGYTFNGWGCDGYYVTESKSFNANLTPLTYSAKFDSNGGSTVSNKTATFNKDLSLPTPYRTGYTFLGWYLNGNLYNDSIKYTYTNDVTFTARWQINSYNVKIVSDDKTCGTVNSFDGEKQYKSSVNLIATTKTEIVNSKCTLVFVGWFGNDVFLSSNLTYTATTPSNDIVYTAKWAKITISSNNSQAGDISGLKTINKVGDSLTITASTNLGYEFLGWYDGYKMVSDKATFTFAMPNTTKALVAKYKVADEMENFVFSSDQTSCIINGIKNKNITGIVVPNYVTCIGDSSFSGCSKLTSVTIGSGVTSIGDYAFYGCTGLTSITIPDSVTSIGKDAFEGCTGLTNITIPNSVTSIGNSAFEGCTGLTIVNWNATECTSAGSYNYPIFNGCSNLATVNIGDKVKTIPSSAFRGCTGLTSITIPGSVTSIGSSALSGCTGLTSITIPDSVTSIGGSAFAGCTGLTSITIPDSVTSIGDYVFEGCNGLTTVTIGNGVISIGKYSFQNCTLLSSVTIGNSVTSIGIYAFYNCTGLTSITIPDSVTSIDQSAFSGCSSLKSVTIGNSVTNIGDNAFQGCTGLTSVTITNGVTSIGYATFSGCTGLTSITIPNCVTSIGGGAFSGCSSLESITIPFVGAKAGVTSSDWYQYPLGYIFGTLRYTGGAATEQYYYGSSTSSTTSNTYYIPSSLKSVTVTGGNIPYGAFYKCTGLTSITIPDSVTSIGERAFYNCSGLTSVTIPNSVTSIGERAFYNCTGLTSITIPNGVTAIPSYAFYGCTGLTSITIPGSVTSIGGGAFYNCDKLQDLYITDIAAWCNISSLDNLMVYGSSKNLYINNELATSITIPNGVTAIRSYAFHGCKGLTSITIPDSVTSIGKDAFYRCTGLTSVTIPDSVTSIGEYAFSGCTGLTKIIGSSSPASVVAKQCGSKSFEVVITSGTSIGGSAFEGCSGLTSIIIPDSVTNIGDSAFRGCTGLSSITIPDSVTNIGDSAFRGCTGLSSITIPDSVTSIGSWAFKDCTWLTTVNWNATACTSAGSSDYPIFSKLATVNIGDNVKIIPSYAFSGCAWLTSVTIGKGVTSIGSSAFRDCSNLQNIYITDIAAWCNISGLGNLMYFGASNKKLYINNELATSITIPDSVTSIGDSAFERCTGLKSVTIGDSVTSIGFRAFKGCTGLTSITIPDSVTSIDNSAFWDCTGLTSVTIGKGVTSIGSSAFEGCKGLTTVNWNATACTSAGSSVYPIFKGCSNLATVNIGDNVKIIPSYAFSGCTGLTRISFNGTVNQWNAISKNYNWKDNVPATQVRCTDGTVSI